MEDNKIKSIIAVARKYNGMITSHQITDLGFSRGNLPYLVDQNRLEKVSRGVYVLPEFFEDEMYTLHMRFKRGIYSHETALFLWDLADRTPHRYAMTFPSTYNITKPKKEHIRCRQVTSSLFDLGATFHKTPCGNSVRVYNMERTLCDILKPRSAVDIQLITDAFKRYVVKKDKNIPLLSEYAKIHKVEQKLRPYLEVLL